MRGLKKMVERNEFNEYGRYNISGKFKLFDSPSSHSLRAERDDCIADAIRVSRKIIIVKINSLNTISLI